MDRVKGLSRRRWFAGLLALLGFCGLASGTQRVRGDDANVEPSPAVTVVSFNIRFDNPSDGPNAWPHRREWVAELLRETQADAIGLQEVLAHQLDELVERLPEYEAIGVGRDDGQRRGEFSPLLIHKERWRIVSWKTWWLSENPEKIGSRGWDAALPRVATYAELESRVDGRRWHLVNTHFDHRGATARLESAKLLGRLVAEAAADHPWVLIGDLNATADAEPLQALIGDEPAVDGEVAQGARLRDAFACAANRRGPDSTWNGFREIDPGQRIDHVLVSEPIKVLEYEVVDQRREGRFPSDHLPVVTKLMLFSDR